MQALYDNAVNAYRSLALTWEWRLQLRKHGASGTRAESRHHLRPTPADATVRRRNTEARSTGEVSWRHHYE